MRAYTFARDVGSEVWDFALEIDTLFNAGLTISDLRWLVAKRFAEHAQETSVYGGSHRSFRRGDGFFFDASTCVVLSLGGATFVDRFLREQLTVPKTLQPFDATSIEDGATARRDDGARHDHDPEEALHTPFKPRWHPMRRELLRRPGRQRFRVPAKNQEVILSGLKKNDGPIT